MLQNQSELAKTREKLRLLEASYEEARLENSGDEELRKAEIESLARFIKQLKDKIALRVTAASSRLNQLAFGAVHGQDRRMTPAITQRVSEPL